MSPGLSLPMSFLAASISWGVRKKGVIGLLCRGLGLILGRFRVDMIIRTTWLLLQTGGPFVGGFIIRALLWWGLY